MAGLIEFKTATTLEHEDALKENELRNEYGQALETNLASHIRKAWERNRNSKQDVLKRLLACLRARKGVYSDAELNQISQQGGADPIYLKLTGTKSRAAAAWIRDIVLPIKDKPWGLSPTPIPELPEDIIEGALKAIYQQIAEMQQQGMNLSPEEVDQFTDSVKKKTLDQLQLVAQQKIQNAERKIEDIMVDGGFKKALEDFIEDFVTYPFAVIKGPYYQPKMFLAWQNGMPVPKQELKLCWRRVSPFDIYPSPYCSNIQDGDLIELLKYSREHLYSLIGVEGYKEDAIREVLAQHDMEQIKDWIWENWEKERLETGSTYLEQEKDTIDALHYWGVAKGQDLIDWGYKGKIEDPLKMYPVDAILIGKHVIRAEINQNPMGHRPYHSACWDSVPGSLIGIALPEQMEDHQKMVNATARALATNMSIGAGPQVGILTDMMATGEDITSVYPMKIWQMKSSLTGNSGKPIEFFQPEIKAQELLMVLDKFEQKADDVTNVPRYSYGNEKIGGAGSTATGLSMLMNSAAKGIRRAIANIDLNVMQPTVYQTYVEIMMNNPDPDIRGDVKVVPKGSAAILIKEQMLANSKEFLQIVTNDYDMAIMGKRGRARLLSSIAKSLDMDPLVLPSDEELAAEEQQEKQMAMEQHQAEIAANGPQMSPEEIASLQQQAQEIQQQAQQIEQAGEQVDAKEKLVDKQASQVESELKRLQQLQKQIEDQMAALEAQKIDLELQAKRAKAEIEEEKLDLKLETKKSVTDIKVAKADLKAQKANAKKKPTKK